MSKFTPGPWKVSASTFDGDESLDYKRVETKDCSVADLILIDADANLIAAAPELLQLLREAQRLGLTFSRGNAYIRAAYIEAQDDLNKRINAVTGRIP